MKSDHKTPQKRRYPPLYEKLIPIAIGLIIIAIVVVLVIIVLVMAGVIG
jgi:hypothetical protein